MSKSIKIIILSCLGLLLLAALLIGLFWPNIFVFENINNKVEVVFDETYDLKEFNNIKINTISSDVKFIRSDNNQVNVLIKSNKKDNFEVALENDLNITLDDKNKICFGFCFYNSEVIISIPENIKNNISIKTVSGEIDADVNMENKLKAHTTSGDINLRKLKESDIKTVSGDIRFLYSEIINIETVSGEVNVSELNLKNNGKIKTVSGDVDVDKINDIYISTKTTSGDVYINSNNKNSEIELNILTTSGDIEVRN